MPDEGHHSSLSPRSTQTQASRLPSLPPPTTPSRNCKSKQILLPFNCCHLTAIIITNTLSRETKGEQSPEKSVEAVSQGGCRGQDPPYLPYYTGKVPRTAQNLTKIRWIQISYVFLSKRLPHNGFLSKHKGMGARNPVTLRGNTPEVPSIQAGMVDISVAGVLPANPEVQWHVDLISFCQAGCPGQRCT